MINAIIIDDEQHCINKLESLLIEHCSDTIALKGSFLSVEEGIKAIKHIQPALVFLDVRIKAQTGFDLLKQVPLINFDIIFTTAHDTYAVQAFRFSAIDYLLKSMNGQELLTAVGKIQNKFLQADVTEKFTALFL